MTGQLDQIETDAAPGNRILRTLPDATRKRLAPHLHAVPLVAHNPIYHLDDPIKRIYFVDHGMISLVQSMHDGRTVEVGTIGVDGLTGSNTLFGIDTAILDTMVQMSGTGHSIAPDVLVAEAQRCPVLSMLLHAAAHLQVAQIAQTAACNRLHSLEQRCCRWLLTAADNAGAAQFSLTHDFLAMMLGVQRPGVTLTARALQDEGYIRYSRGRVTVLDRTRLEAKSCECYATIRGRIDRMFEAAAKLA